MPVSTKETASLGSSIVPTIKSAINNLGFYSEDKFKGVNNPLLGLIKQAEDDEKTTGAPSSTIINRIYMILEQLGIQIYAIIGE
jgi:hypothetical protein